MVTHLVTRWLYDTVGYRCRSQCRIAVRFNTRPPLGIAVRFNTRPPLVRRFVARDTPFTVRLNRHYACGEALLNDPFCRATNITVPCTNSIRGTCGVDGDILIRTRTLKLFCAGVFSVLPSSVTS